MALVLVKRALMIFLQIYFRVHVLTAKGELLYLQIFAFSVRAVPDIKASQQIVAL